MAKLTLHDLYRKLPADGSVLDVGCFGFGQYYTAQQLGLPSLKHAGVDYCELKDPAPPGYEFRLADLNAGPIPFGDDSFDLIVGNHVIEHMRDPVAFFGECARVCKPGGLIYLAAPSERSLLLPGFPFSHDMFFSLSFYDDPTHASRPWSPQSFHRLARYYHCEPLHAGYETSWKRRLAAPLLIPAAWLLRRGGLLEATIWRTIGWASYLIARKPDTLRGKPEFYYYIPPNRR